MGERKEIKLEQAIGKLYNGGRVSFDSLIPGAGYVCKKIPGQKYHKAEDDGGFYTVPLTWETLVEVLAGFKSEGIKVDFSDEVKAALPSERPAKFAKGANVDQLARIGNAVLKPRTAPWEHQHRGFHWALYKRRAMLDMDMGTGKSKVIVDLICHLGHRGDIQRALIICPKTVSTIWPEQFEEHGWNRDIGIAMAAEGPMDKRVEAIDITSSTVDLGNVMVAIVNYDAIHRKKMAQTILALEWDLVVLDESHKVKAPGGTAARFVARIPSKRRICLTGTTMPHSPLDIYSQFRFLDPAIFGTSVDNFRNRYANVIDNYNRARNWRSEALAKKMSRLTYTVKIKDVMDLPPVVNTRARVELEKEAREFYDKLLRDAIAELEGEKITTSIILTKILRLSQITGGWVKLDERDTQSRISTAKKDALKDYIEGIDNQGISEPIVVFCQFIQDLEVVHEVAKAVGRESYELSGRKNALEFWKADDTGPILAVQIRAGGHGIDLTKARYVIYYSLGYSLGEYEQSRARIYRPGQTRTAIYHHLIARGTIDEEIYAALADKKVVVKAVAKYLEVGDQWEKQKRP